MSETLSHSSHGSPGTLGPDASISQVLPQYSDDFRIYRLPVLYAAVALDPDTKLKYFEIEWKERPD